jgi:DNA modification methylase
MKVHCSIFLVKDGFGQTASATCEDPSDTVATLFYSLTLIKMENKFILGDCMDKETGLPSYPDNYFGLAIVDPPYGIGVDVQSESTSKHGGRRAIEFKGWDNTPPDASYFSELFRVSKNQIIWGANYYPQHLPPSMGWIFWDKGQRICGL